MTSITNTENIDHQEYKGCKFVFAYYNSIEKVWYVQPRKFVLLEHLNKNILSGQFLQSTWFQKKYTKNTKGLFVVLQVKKNCSSKKIEKDMNSLKNPFPTLYDIPPYCIRASYFQIPWEIMNGLDRKATTEDGFAFTMRAHNNPWDKLSITVYKNPENDGILITHPTFEIPI